MCRLFTVLFIYIKTWYETITKESIKTKSLTYKTGIPAFAELRGGGGGVSTLFTQIHIQQITFSNTHLCAVTQFNSFIQGYFSLSEETQYTQNTQYAGEKTFCRNIARARPGQCYFLQRRLSIHYYCIKQGHRGNNKHILFSSTCQRQLTVKVPKREIFQGSDFELCTFSQLVILKYKDFVSKNFLVGEDPIVLLSLRLSGIDFNLV